MTRGTGEYAWIVIAGAVPVVQDAMDVRDAEVEDAAGAERAGRRHVRPADALLAHRALDDRDRAAAPVVVVEAGVVPGHPADEPRDRVLGLQERVERALRRVVAHVGAPQRRASAARSSASARSSLRAERAVVRHAASCWAPVSRRMALTVASRRGRGWRLRVGAVGAVDERVGSDRRAHRGERGRPVGRGVVEDERIVRRRPRGRRARRGARRAAARARRARRRARAGAGAPRDRRRSRRARRRGGSRRSR